MPFFSTIILLKLANLNMRAVTQGNCEKQETAFKHTKWLQAD